MDHSAWSKKRKRQEKEKEKKRKIKETEKTRNEHDRKIIVLISNNEVNNWTDLYLNLKIIFIFKQPWFGPTNTSAARGALCVERYAWSATRKVQRAYRGAQHVERSP